jgi:aryl-alcohol dehydrogenase-like predicted oxidoreductase
VRRLAGSGNRASSEKLYRWVSEEYADSDRNWATIDAVGILRKRLARHLQVALSCIADRPGVTAPILGALTAKPCGIFSEQGS